MTDMAASLSLSLTHLKYRYSDKTEISVLALFNITDLKLHKTQDPPKCPTLISG